MSLTLQVKAKHFKDTAFIEPNCNCALEKSAVDFFDTEDVSEYVYGIEINGVEYRHIRYNFLDYDRDYELAASHSFDETVIRTIELIEQ